MMFNRISPRLAAALLGGGALGIALTTALEVVTAPYSAAVSLYAINGVVHIVKVAAVVAFICGLVGFWVHLRDRLGLTGSIAVWALVVATLIGPVPYSLVEASLDPSLAPAAASAQLEAIYAANGWIGALATVALLLVLISIVTLAVVILRRGVLPAWAPILSLAAIPVALAAGVVAFSAGLPIPHPPAWIFLGLASYGPALALTRGVTSSTVRTPG